MENVPLALRVAVLRHQRVERLLGRLVGHLKPKPKQYQSFVYLDDLLATQSAHGALVLDVLHNPADALRELAHQIARSSCGGLNVVEWVVQGRRMQNEQQTEEDEWRDERRMNNVPSVIWRVSLQEFVAKEKKRWSRLNHVFFISCGNLSSVSASEIVARKKMCSNCSKIPPRTAGGSVYGRRHEWAFPLLRRLKALSIMIQS